MNDKYQCTCHSCIKKFDLRDPSGTMPLNAIQMIVCPICGDKRCVTAYNHEAPCAKHDLYAHNSWIEKRYILKEWLS